MRFPPLVPFVLFLAVAGAAPRPLSALTLEEAFARVLASHPQLRARQEEERAARGTLAAEQAAGGLRAEAGLDLLARSSRLGGTSAFLATRRQRVSVLVPLFDGGRSDAEVAAARAEAEAARWRRIAEGRALLARTVEAYAAVLRDRRLLELALADERLLAEELAAAKRRYRLGAGTAAAVALAEARLARATAERRRRVAELAVSGARLRALVGTEVAELADPGTPAPLPASLDGALAALSSDPRLEAAAAHTAAARARARAEAAAGRPALDLVADLAWTGGADPRSDTVVDVAFGARLRMPLWDGGARRERVRAAWHRAGAAEAAGEAEQRRLEEEVATLFARLEAAQARTPELERARRAARLLLEAARREARTGTRAPVDVLDAVRELHDAETALVLNAHARLVAAWHLAIALGALDDHLEEPAPDPPAAAPPSSRADGTASPLAPPAAPFRSAAIAEASGATMVPATEQSVAPAAGPDDTRATSPARPENPPSGAFTPDRTGEDIREPAPRAPAGERREARRSAMSVPPAAPVPMLPPPPSMPEPAAGPQRAGAVALHGRLTEMR